MPYFKLVIGFILMRSIIKRVVRNRRFDSEMSRYMDFNDAPISSNPPRLRRRQRRLIDVLASNTERSSAKKPSLVGMLVGEGTPGR